MPWASKPNYSSVRMDISRVLTPSATRAIPCPILDFGPSAFVLTVCFMRQQLFHEYVGYPDVCRRARTV